MHMPFGRHRGQPLEEIPLDYLRWLHDSCDLREPLRSGVEVELDAREWDQSPDPLVSTTISTDVIATWHRKMAVRFHPDKGGSHAAMVAVNFGRELLLQLAEGAA